MTLLQENKGGQSWCRRARADPSYSLPSRARFRCNIFQQRGVYSIVMRVIPTDIPTLGTLGLPRQLAEIAELRNGLVLITGPTGSGKSSTLAAVIDIINEQKHYHVVAIEDPIEYLHTHKNSTINQREVGHDTKDFPSALRAALRQAPKVILIGEMRDYETTEIALEAAETGHLVLSTRTHDGAKKRSNASAVSTRKGVVRACHSETRARANFAPHFVGFRPGFRGLIFVRRIFAVEILKSTPRTREYIESGEAEGKSLLDAMHDGKLEGMQDFDTVIKDSHRTASHSRLRTAPSFCDVNQNNLQRSLRA